MNIVEKWREMTKCRNCCKAVLRLGFTDSVFCKAKSPDKNGDPRIVSKKCRCDSGVWLFKGAYMNTFFPLNLFEYLRLCADLNTDRKLEVIPRNQWPEVQDD